MLKYIICALSFSLVCNTASASPIVDVEGRRYEIQTVTGLLSIHRETIASQVWFGNSELARTFANEVGNVLGIPNYGIYGPMFSYYIYEGIGADYTSGWVYYTNRFQLPPGNRAQVNNATAGSYYTYAVAKDLGATEIPEPNSLTLLIAGAVLLVRRQVDG